MYIVYRYLDEDSSRNFKAIESLSETCSLVCSSSSLPISSEKTKLSFELDSTFADKSNDKLIC